MKPGLFVLTGFPGTGKLTVARALASLLEARSEVALVVDNHWIANPIFGLVEQDGVTPLPQGVWEHVGQVAAAVFSTVKDLTPRSWHVIFTTFLDGVTDIGFLERLEALSESRRAVYVPVRLLCSPEENARRIVAPGRRERMKSVDPDEPYRLGDKGEPFDSGHPHTLSLDITSLPPQDAAAEILNHYGELATRAEDGTG